MSFRLSDLDPLNGYEISDALEFFIDDYDDIDYRNILQELLDSAIQEKD